MNGTRSSPTAVLLGLAVLLPVTAFEAGGASLIIAEGALDDPAPEAIFGLQSIGSIHGGNRFNIIPGLLYFFLGVNDPGVGFAEAAMNHSPRFYVNEESLPVGVRAMATLAYRYLAGGS